MFCQIACLQGHCIARPPWLVSTTDARYAIETLTRLNGIAPECRTHAIRSRISTGCPSTTNALSIYTWYSSRFPTYPFASDTFIGSVGHSKPAIKNSFSLFAIMLSLGGPQIFATQPNSAKNTIKIAIHQYWQQSGKIVADFYIYNTKNYYFLQYKESY